MSIFGGSGGGFRRAGIARGRRNPEWETEAGVPATNALEERRRAWEVDPKPSRDNVRERGMYLIARTDFEQLRTKQANVNVRIAMRVRSAGAALNVYQAHRRTDELVRGGDSTKSDTHRLAPYRRNALRSNATARVLNH
jgi:hypothetical protein